MPLFEAEDTNDTGEEGTQAPWQESHLDVTLAYIGQS